VFEHIFLAELLLDLVLLHLDLEVIDVEDVEELNHVASREIHDVQALRCV
jgi:hypothetical protein